MDITQRIFLSYEDYYLFGFGMLLVLLNLIPLNNSTFLDFMYNRTIIIINDKRINKFIRVGDKILLNPFANLLFIDFDDFILFNFLLFNLIIIIFHKYL